MTFSFLRSAVPSAAAGPIAARTARSRRTPAALLALAMALSAILPAWPGPARAQHALPALGDTASADLPPVAERQLGERIMRDIRRDPAYLEDAVLQDYLHTLWSPLLEAARARGDVSPDLDTVLSWEAFLVRDRSVNAFALPGGYVGVHLGLIAVTRTRDELASVLAHELAHVTQRHIARSIARERQQSLMALAGMILGVLAASRSPAAGEALITGGQAAAIAGQLGFSREMEREADRIGLGILMQGGFEPAGMSAMFDRLAQAARLNDTGAFPYLRTHPLTVERIGEAQSRLGLPSAPSAPPSDLLHAAMQARARVLMDTSTQARREWQQRVDEAMATPPSGDAAERLWQLYGGALDAALAREWPRAQAALARAAEVAAAEAPAARAVAWLAVEVATLRGDAAQAQRLLDALAPPDGPGAERTVALLQGQAASLPGADPAQVRHAAERLQTWTVAHPLDAAAWQTLALVWRQAGQMLRSLRAQAEGHLARGDASGAVDRLRAAQQLARTAATADYVEASVIDARLRVAQGVLLRQQEEERQRPGG